MDHKELVDRAAKWLRNTVGCNPVFAELVTTSEVPDAIGWKYGQVSVLVECKATRSDFLADKKKFFRTSPSYGMGDFRYYMCPEGLVSVDELPERWGLLYAGKKITVQRRSEVPGTKYSNLVYGQAPFESNKVREMKMLISALRRCGLRWDLSEIQKPLNENS